MGCRELQLNDYFRFVGNDKPENPLRPCENRNIKSIAEGFTYSCNSSNAWIKISSPEFKDTVYLTDPANLTGYSQVLEESTNGTLTKSYTLGDDVLSQTSFQNSSTPELKNFLSDGHGSTRLLTSATSAIASRFDYDCTYRVWPVLTGSGPLNFIYSYSERLI